MKSNKSTKHIVFISKALVLCGFAGLFLFLWLLLKPHLFYHIQEPRFLFTIWFLHEYLGHPGGIVEYFSAFFYQFFKFPWAGALVLTTLTGLFYVIGRRILDLFSPMPFLSGLAFIPFLFILAMISAYVPILTLALACLVAITLFWLLAVIARERTLLRLFLFTIGAIVVYVLAGAALYVFLALALLYEVFQSRSLINILALVAIGALLPLVATNVFLITTDQAFFHLLPSKEHSHQHLFWALYSAFPVLVLLLKIIPPLKLTKASKWAGLVQSVLIPAAIAAVIAGVFDHQQKLRLELQDHARYRQWDKVLQDYKSLENPDLLSGFLRNMALLNKGTLLDDLFTYRNPYQDKTLYLPQDPGVSKALYRSDFEMSINYVNSAHRWAYEAFSQNKETPWNMQRLAECNIIKREYNAAQKCINILRKMWFYENTANEYQQYVRSDTALTTNELLRRVREHNTLDDFVVRSLDERAEDAEILLESNPKNRAAYDYLIAACLLRAKVGKLINHLDELDQVGYTSVPRHVEEAIILYVTNTKNTDILKKHLPSLYTMNRYKQFHQKVSRYKDDPTLAAEILADDFGDTYWYYVLFSGYQSR